MALVEIFLSAFITVLFEKLASVDLLSFARREGIHSLVKRWTATLAQIQEVVDDAEEKQIEKDAVGSWMEELRDLTYDLDDVLDELAYEALQRKLTNAEQHHQATSSSSSSSSRSSMVSSSCSAMDGGLVSAVSGRNIGVLGCCVTSVASCPPLCYTCIRVLCCCICLSVGYVGNWFGS